MTKASTILGIDPGTRFLGAVVLSGRDLRTYAVHQLRNGEHPYESIGQALRTVFRYIEQYSPQIVAIEAPYLIASPRGAVLTVLAKEIHERAKDFGLHVLELSPEAVRKQVVGNRRATKIEVAEALARGGFSDLGRLVPKRPARPALGLRPRDKYWLHVFDALALAVAAQVGEYRPLDTTSVDPNTTTSPNGPKSDTRLSNPAVRGTAH